MNWRHLLWIVPVTAIVAISVLAIAGMNRDVPNSTTEREMSHYWACMDGCSNMEELINGKPAHDDAPAYLRHQICAEVCCRQYMPTLGCAS